jgi:hypothetical protein
MFILQYGYIIKKQVFLSNQPCLFNVVIIRILNKTINLTSSFILEYTY